MNPALKKHERNNVIDNIAIIEKPIDKKLLFSALIGNTLEYYDYLLYIAYASIISKTFLPRFSAATIVYIGLLARPFGALIFGHIGDKFSRRYALSLTLYLMAIPSLILCFLPPYEKIGILAGALVLFARSLQSFCAAGELNGAAIVSLEMKARCYINGLVNASCSLGAILSYTAAWLLGPTRWRYAFFTGLLIALVGYQIRKRMMSKLAVQKDFVPLSQIFKTHKKQMLIVSLLGGEGNSVLLMIYVVIPQLVGNVAIGVIGVISLFISHLFFGFVADLVKNKTIFFIIAAFLSMFLTYPTIIAVQNGWHLTGVAIFATIAGIHNSAQHLYCVSLFPKNMRYRGISFSFVTGAAVCASLMPMSLGVFFKNSAALSLTIMSSISFVVFTCRFLQNKFFAKKDILI